METKNLNIPSYGSFVNDLINSNEKITLDDFILSSLPDWVIPSMVENNSSIDHISNMITLIPNLNKFTKKWKFELKNNNFILRQYLQIPIKEMSNIESSLYYILSGHTDPRSGIIHLHGYKQYIPEIKHIRSLQYFSIILFKMYTIDVSLVNVEKDDLSVADEFMEETLTYALEVDTNILFTKYFNTLLDIANNLD